MLKRLLFSHQRPGQLLIGIFGALVGLLLLLGALQLYHDFNVVLNGGDVNRPQYLVINKEVNVLNSLFGGQKGFSSAEMAELKKIKDVRNVAPLTPSKFKVSVTMGAGGMEGMPGMYTELFFEAVPDNFIDVNASDWQWKEGDSLVPIVIPREYLNLYNFGFSRSQNLPQVTEGLLGLARFNINIKGANGSAVFKGRLVGLTDRINTILAPQSFIDYANEKFAGEPPGSVAPSRVIIECEGTATTELIAYFTGNGYETSAEALRNSRLNSFLRAVTGVIVFIGLVIIVLAVTCFLLYSQLVVSKSKYELETLIRIGYDYRKLSLIYLKYYGLIYAGIFVFCIPALWVFNGWFGSYMKDKGFDLPGGVSGSVILWGFLFTLVFFGLNSYSIFSNLKKLAK